MILFIAAVVAAGLAAWAAGLFRPRLRIAALVPLSGVDAKLGAGMRNSIQLAIEETNRAGGIEGRKVALLAVDDGSNADQAKAGAREIGADARVLGAIGTCDATAYSAVQPIFGESRVPFIPGAFTGRDLSAVALGAYPNEASVLPFGTASQAQAAKYAVEILGIRDFVYVRDNSYSSFIAINHFRAGTSALIGHTETGEELLLKSGDLDALVQRLKARPPGYIFYGGTPGQAAQLITQLRAAGVTSPFQTETRYPSEDFIELAKGNTEGALAVFPGLPAQDFAEGREFLKRYAAAGFAEPPSFVGPYAYAETQVLLAAMGRSFLSRPSVAGTLKNGSFESILGQIRFNYVGSSYMKFAIYKVVQGRWTPIYVTQAGKLQPFQPQ